MVWFRQLIVELTCGSGVKILDFARLFRPIVGAVIGGKWKILGVTSSGPREVFVDVEEVNNKP
jgi:hypothetical protein